MASLCYRYYIRVRRIGERYFPFALFSVAAIALIAVLALSRRPLLWGAYVGQNPGDLAAFESQVGKRVDVQSYFMAWGDDFPDGIAAALAPRGNTLLLYWLQTGASLDDILGGKYDAYIAAVAQEAKDYGSPVIFAPFHEMNGNWDSWSGTVGTNTPAKLIAAWRHVRTVFGVVPNAKFMWIVNSGSVPDTPGNAIGAYYPGGAYVDYVGVDGFNFNRPPLSWDEIFSPQLMTQLASYGKPIFISSTGSVPGANQMQWIADMAAGVKKYPRIVGWIWFNKSDGTDNFLVNASSETLAAFKKIIP